MIIVATTSLLAVDHPNADRWNTARSCQKSGHIGDTAMVVPGFLKLGLELLFGGNIHLCLELSTHFMANFRQMFSFLKHSNEGEKGQSHMTGSLCQGLWQELSPEQFPLSYFVSLKGHHGRLEQQILKLILHG